MKSLVVLKRAVIATACVVALFGTSRPAAANGVIIAPPAKFFYVITAPPNWGIADPQFPSSLTALTALVPMAPGAPENYVSLGLQGYANTWFAYDTFLGEANGFIGADVSVPTAQWLTPSVYSWSGGPAGGGALAFFNSFNPFNGTFYANMMIVDDPQSCGDALSCLGGFETSFGNTSGALTPNAINPNADGSLPVLLPQDHFDQSIAPNPSEPNVLDAGSQFVPTPEGPTALSVLLGALAVAAGVGFRRRRHLLACAA